MLSFDVAIKHKNNAEHYCFKIQRIIYIPV